MQTTETGYESDDNLQSDTDDGVRSGSMLDALRQEAQQKVRLDDLTLRVPQRSKMQLVFDINIENAQLTHWRKQAVTRKGKREDFNAVKFSQIILAATNKELIFSGQPTGLGLQDRELWEMFGANSYFSCIKAMYGSDADIIRAGSDVINAAGYGDESEEDEDLDDDPTQTS